VEISLSQNVRWKLSSLLILFGISLAILPVPATAEEDAIVMLSDGREFLDRGIVWRRSTGNVRSYYGLRIQLVPLEELAGQENFVPVADQVFEEILGLLAEASLARRAVVSFGTVRSGTGEDWSASNRNVDYVRRRNGTWRRNSHFDIDVGEPTTPMDPASEVELMDGEIVGVFPARLRATQIDGLRHLDVEYETAIDGDEFSTLIANSIYFWQNYIEPAPQAERADAVKITAHSEPRRERFDFRCGLTLTLSRDSATGLWPDLTGEPFEIETEALGSELLFVRSRLGNQLSASNNCSGLGYAILVDQLLNAR